MLLDSKSTKSTVARHLISRDDSKTMQEGLLVCSICGSDLNFCGKFGAILRTKCPHCGTSSDSMIDSPLPQKEEVQIYYKTRASASR